MLIDLRDRVAVVTGAARGIGRHVTERLAAEGVITAGLDIRTDQLKELGAALPGPSAQLECDVSDEEQVARSIDEVIRRFGRVDILVNNAGITAGGATETLAAESWRRCHEVNLTGTFLCCQAVIPQMKKQRSGRIINAASFAAIMPTVGGAAYGSSKAAVAHFTRVVAAELGPWGITANAYAPGMIPTEMNHFAERSEADQERLLDMLTIRRWGSKDDIANLICFLSSDQAEYITGTMIDVSGGKFATQQPRAAYDRAEKG
ncbi:MAG TPA: SDR family NAD(P)-dependent oxidoreductase [Mycobacteriales bacterium]|nr:SDR family NAD(P)-dependent oxidoreductase [Mycobacteriales bacterium]